MRNFNQSNVEFTKQKKKLYIGLTHKNYSTAPEDKIFSPDKFHRVQSLDDLSLSVCIVLGEKLVLSKSQPCP